MRKPRGRIFVALFVATVVIVAACGGPDDGSETDAFVPDAVVPGDAGGTADDGVAGDVPAGADVPRDATADANPVADPAEPGPWRAGVRTVTLVDPARDRSLPVDIWYPVDPAAVDGADNAYALDIGIAVIGEFASDARRDATPAAAPAGGWPFVVFSHGFGGVRFQSAFLCEHLATHGWVVAAPDHVGNTVADLASLDDEEAVAQSAAERPLDLAFVRDALLRDDDWPLDPARVAAAGHSFGGWTAVEAAARDDGFRVVLALAPGFLRGASPERTADLDRPLCIFAGTRDRTTPFAEHQQPAWEAAQPPKLLVAFEGAGHFDFTHLCELPAAKPIYDGDGCDPAVVDWTTVFAHVNTIGTAFLARHLDGDDRYEPWLTAERLAAVGGLSVWRAP